MSTAWWRARTTRSPSPLLHPTRCCGVTVSANGTGCTVSHMAGNRDERGFADGDAEHARFDHQWDLVALRGGRLAVADWHNHRVRECLRGAW